MFSGLTNQVSSWMGAVKGDEEVPPPTGEQGELQNPQGDVGNVDVDQAQAAFENINVGEGGEENGAKATR